MCGSALEADVRAELLRALRPSQSCIQKGGYSYRGGARSRHERGCALGGDGVETPGEVSSHPKTLSGGSPV